jgi:hypothetical protein
VPEGVEAPLSEQEKFVPLEPANGFSEFFPEEHLIKTYLGKHFFAIVEHGKRVWLVSLPGWLAQLIQVMLHLIVSATNPCFARKTDRYLQMLCGSFFLAFPVVTWA